jgi:cytoskeletal protein CcmA (bactofilin family)
MPTLSAETRGSLSNSESNQQAESRETSLPASKNGGTATIAKHLRVKGEVIVSESLFVEGKVEGLISAPDHRVTIGQDAEVYADIKAREVIVLGKVLGNVDARDRVDIRSDGWLTGVISTRRIHVGDGAYLRGGISIIV